MAKTTKTRAAKAAEPASNEEMPAEAATFSAVDATADDAAAGTGEPTPATDTLPSEEVAPAAEDGATSPSASDALGEQENTEGAPTGESGGEPAGSLPSEPDAPATAAAAGEDQVLPEPAPTLQEQAGESGKAPGAEAASVPEPAFTSRLEFLTVSPIELDGQRYEAGAPILLSRKVHAELRAARAIAGDWPSD